MNKLLVILGPTATGKTDLAIQLAHKFKGELVSVDSRQVYKGLDIGTGKMPGGKFQIEKADGYWQINGIKIWMYDVVSPKRQYNAALFVKDANKVIEEIIKRGKLPIIVGGSGLYLKALVDGLSNLAIQLDKNLRKKLYKLSKEQLQKKLRKVSSEKWEGMNSSDRENPRRLVRVIELEISPRRSQYGHLRGGSESYNVLKIGLTAKREILYQKSDERVISRMKQGMIEEVKRLHRQGLTFKRMRQLGLEYGVLADYMDKKFNSQDELIEILQNKIHGFVRRQLTWFKKEKDVIWFDIIKEDYFKSVEELVTKWYDGSNRPKIYAK